jgi:hypothetical protein
MSDAIILVDDDPRIRRASRQLFTATARQVMSRYER